MFCPEGEQLEAAYRELGDGVTQRAFTRLPDGAAHLLDHVVVDLVKGLKALNSLVRPERGSRALREEKRATEHRNCAVALLEFDRFFGWGVNVFIPSFSLAFLVVATVNGVFVRGLAAVPPCLASTLESLIVSTRHEHLSAGLGLLSDYTAASGHCRSCVGLVGRQLSVRFFVAGYCVVAVGRRELAVVKLVSRWVCIN
jgi:hypothetical protein